MNNLKLNVIPADSHIFIDSNIFTYHLLGHKRYRDSVRDFLIKIESGIYTGYINDVVSEVYHNFIRVKICDKYNIKPVVMKNLHLIHDIEIGMVEENMPRYNLLSSDAIHISSCKLKHIEYMATNDYDFEKVDFLKLWMP